MSWVTARQQDAVVWGSPGFHWEIMFPFLKYIWKRVYYLSKDKRPARHDGTAMGARGQRWVQRADDLVVAFGGASH